MKPIAIVQARTGSKRLPGKVLASICGISLVEYVILRCQLSIRLGGVILATSNKKRDDLLEDIACSMGIGIYRGSESDVLGRYLKAAETVGSEVIVRITADCPLIDPRIIDQAVDAYRTQPADYVYIRGYPNGLGAAEVLQVRALRRAHAETTQSDTYYREHVMTYLTDNPNKFSINIRSAPEDLSRPEIRLSVDEQPDLDLVRKICEYFYPRRDFGAAEIIEFLDKNPEVAGINAKISQRSDERSASSVLC